MGFILISVFICAAAYYDSIILKNKYIYNHSSRFIFRALIVLSICIITKINFIDATILFYILFDYILNIFRGVPVLYAGSTSKIDQLYQHISSSLNISSHYLNLTVKIILLIYIIFF